MALNTYRIFVCIYLCFGILYTLAQNNVTLETESSEQLLDLQLTPGERTLMQNGLKDQREQYQQLHRFTLDNSVVPAMGFSPLPLGASFDRTQHPIDWNLPEKVTLPDSEKTLAFYRVAELASLIKSRQITSLALTQLFLKRLKQYGDTLHCVITLTEELALRQAKRADQELARGIYRGPLHGIPYGVKDLLAVEGYPTTWGAMTYKDQRLETTASVVRKLEEAGAVLLAKLSMGALAWGDVWYGAKTRNPWNLEQGSSGSSAGSASATSAGLVPFAIGTETLGSIVSPSTRCGITGLRPSYGRVSRYGAMALSWSMDKIGPMCRSAEDCALVFEVIQGVDSLDQSLFDLPFNYQAKVDLSKLKVGYLHSLFEKKYPTQAQDQASLKALQNLGAELIPVSLPDPEKIPISSLSLILTAEAAAAFDELTRSNQDSLLVRQIENAWPNVFRTARFIPAVEYLQANRYRTLLIQEMHKIMQQVDVLVAPSFGGNQLLITNLTGHPCVVVPNGFNAQGSPTSISFLGNLFEEGTILGVAKAYQDATDFDEQRPDWLK